MLQFRRKLLAALLCLTLIFPLSISDNLIFASVNETLIIEANSNYIVEETTELSNLTIGTGANVSAKEGYLVSLVVNGVEKSIEPGFYSGDIFLTLTEDYSDTVIGSYSGRGGEAFRAGLYIDDKGIVYDRSVEQVMTGGSYNDTSANGMAISGESDNFNAIIVNSADFILKNASINLFGASDGSNTSDFSGLGSAVAAYNNSKVTLDHVDIYTEGVARPAVFTDAGSDTLITDSKLRSMGGTLYDGYVNTADQAKMVAPPWVLGITGNARTTNLMGTLSTSTFVRSDIYANQWGALSTDSGSDMVLTAVDTTMTLLGEKQNDPYSTRYGSGYGTYIIGDAQEYFYGCTFNVGTYASILTGGYGLYASSNFDENLDIYPLSQVPNGTILTDMMGNETEGYDTVKADEPVFTGITGLGQPTIINSDAFGFMAHNSGTLEITDQTLVNTDNATFLMKSGDVNMIVSDGAQLKANDGVILQMMDNDDAIVGADFSQGAPNFNTDFYETQGYPGINYDVDITTENRNTYTFTASDVDLKGDLYNGTGYFGAQASDLLEVTLEANTKLKGDISASSLIHIDEYGNQNTHFTIDEYYYLGHVANRPFYNGGNDVKVTVKKGAEWTVEDVSLLTSLTVESGASLKAPKGKTLNILVNGVKTEIIPDKKYEGNIVLAVTEQAMTILKKDRVISKTTYYLNGLVIEPGVEITAPEGYVATLVVNGNETNLQSGVYVGNVVIAVTNEHTVGYMAETPFGAEHSFHMGLYVENGAIIDEKSVEPVLANMDYDNTSAHGGLIESSGDYFNGIVVGGTSDFDISDVTIFATGNGGNDFAGYGAAIMSTDQADVTVENSYIATDGVISVAVFGGGDSNLAVKNTTIITGDEKTTQGVTAPMMAEVPWILGIYGNTRATNVLEKAQVIYENCFVKANAWGALSTDSCLEGATLTAIDTEVVVTESGYGAYADGDVFDTFTHCQFTVPDYALIVAAGKCGALFNGHSLINSDRFGIMWHKNQDGTVTINEGTVFNTGETAFLIKSDLTNPAFPNLVVDGARINASNGVILHLMESDDPGMNLNGGGPGSDTMWNSSYTVPEVIPVSDDNDITNPLAEHTVDTTFKNMTVTGNIYNTRWTAGQNLSVVFENADITGVISSATQSHTNVAPGERITPDTRAELGEVTARPSETVGNGMLVSLDSATKWTVTDTSYLSRLTLAEGAEITASLGELTMTVDGVSTPITAGTYEGNIVLSIKN